MSGICQCSVVVDTYKLNPWSDEEETVLCSCTDPATVKTPSGRDTGLCSRCVSGKHERYGERLG